MGARDLENYQVNCKYKNEQIAYLQSMLPTENERLASGLGGLARTLAPGTSLADPDDQNNRRSMATGRTQWIIKQKLMELRDDCGVQ